MSTTETIRDMTNMEVPIDRGHVDLLFDACLKKFELEIIAW